MRRDCLCGQPTIAAREIDNMIQIVDAEPVTTTADLDDDAVVLVGNLDNQPTALWGIDPSGDELPWGLVIPAGAPRYRAHHC